MRHFGVVLALASVVVGVSGCGQFSGQPAASSRGGMAVVDLDKVAAETGRDRQLAQALELAQNSLNQSYKKTVTSAKDQLEAKKKGYGDAMSDEQKREFSQFETNAVTQLSQLQNQVREKYELYKQGEIAKFRADLKPITQEIAAKRGLSIVIPKNEGLLLSVDPGVDITDDVIKVLKQKHPVAPEAVGAASRPTDINPTVTKQNSKARSVARETEEDDSDEPIRR